MSACLAGGGGGPQSLLDLIRALLVSSCLDMGRALALPSSVTLVSKACMRSWEPRAGKARECGSLRKDKSLAEMPCEPCLLVSVSWDKGWALTIFSCRMRNGRTWLEQLLYLPCHSLALGTQSHAPVSGHVVGIHPHPQVYAETWQLMVV